MAHMGRSTTARGVIGAAAVLLALAGCAGDEPGSSPDRQFFCVAPTGSDRNDGSCTAPWKTIQKALNTLDPGQTALVRAGDYREDVRVQRSGTKLGRIVLRPYAGQRVVLHGRLRIEANFIRIVGLKIDGRGLNEATQLVYVRGRSVTLERLEVGNSVRAGIVVSDGARDVTVIACWVHDNGDRTNLDDHGIVFARGVVGRIESSLVEKSGAGGIHVYPGYDRVLVNQNTIVRRLVRDSRRRRDNHLGSDCHHEQHRCVQRRTGDPDVLARKPGTGNTAANNLIWGNRADDVSRAGMTQHGNFHAVPGFIHAASGDFRLQRRSPALGQALIRYTARIDRNGQPRPLGQRPAPRSVREMMGGSARSCSSGRVPGVSGGGGPGLRRW